jgi:hypothetical protein
MNTRYTAADAYEQAETLIASNADPREMKVEDWDIEELVAFYDQLRYIATRAEAFRKHLVTIIQNEMEIGDTVTAEGCNRYKKIQVTKYSLDKDVITTEKDLAYLVEQLGHNGDGCVEMVPALVTKKLTAQLKAINLVEKGDFIPDGIKRSIHTELRIQKQNDHMEVTSD